MTKAEARQLHPDWVEALKDRLNTIPEAESYTEASTRTSVAFADVLAQAQAAGHTCAAIVWHGGGMRVLFRDIFKWGELNQIGDCCWVELERATPTSAFTIINAQRIGFEF
jgi:broad specificity phosphatase PhoE